GLGAMVTGQLDNARVAKEIGCMQQVHVQGMAGNPLATVEEPAQSRDLRGDLDAARVLDGQTSAHLVCHRADPANARGDVGWLEVSAVAQERLEEPGRLVNVQLHTGT